MEVKAVLTRFLAKELSMKEDKIASLIETPPDPKLGDLSFPCFELAKTKKKAPPVIAIELSQTLKLPKEIDKVTATGPYLNFFVNKVFLVEQVLGQVGKQKEQYGHSAHFKEKAVIEFAGPNTNKPLHLGHLRNIFLGQAVCTVLASQGFKVTPVNIVNDRGAHICKSMLAYQKWGNKQEPNKKGDHYVGDWYIKYATEEKDHPEMEEAIREMLRKWEEKDPTVKALWKKMNGWVLQGFAETFKRISVQFDEEYYESDFYDKGKDLVEQGLKKGLFVKKPDGEIIAELEPYKLPNKILLRSDGTTIYITQDMALARIRFNDYHMDRMVYVVANEQNLHFQQLFKILELLGFPFAKKCFHLSYGMVLLPEGKMKSREGTVIDADDILDEMEKLALHEIQERHKLEEKVAKERAIQIGHGALRFFLLKYDSVKDITFNPKESLSFEGETGPYVQYAHARICSILRKHGKVTGSKIEWQLLKEFEEIELVKALEKFKEVSIAAAEQYKPHLVARYLLDLAQLFNEYYHKHQVMTPNEDLTQARIHLIDSVRQVLKNGLNLLRIDAPEEM
ncbi:MAG TPA: arginine--tRNA ligase [Candidatus Nanoarchaeia archaeon]|nr:arginine--tRNA ligase [Candidatus Nanoarchaeia archaeon]